MNLYEKMQVFLPEFLVEQIVMENLNKYEEIFFCNKEYFLLTDGQPATKNTCVETIKYCPNGFSIEKINNIGVSYNCKPVCTLFTLCGYPDDNTVYIGLFLMNEEFKRKGVGKKVIKALFNSCSDTAIRKFCLSVQDNNVAGYSFWKSLGFRIVDRSICDGFTNLSMQYNNYFTNN